MRDLSRFIRRGGGYRQRIIAVALTCGIFLASLYAVASVLNSDEISGILNLDYWQKSENDNTDVLFLGSSTVAINIDMEPLWQEYGIAAYSLAASGMRMHDGYYRLLEAERERHTDMLVLDARALVYHTEYDGGMGIRMVNVSGYAWSWDKLSYVQAAIPPEDRLDFFLEFPLNHIRYQSLTKWDFLHSASMGEHNKGTWEIYSDNTYTPSLPAAQDVTTYRAAGEKEEFYFRKIIEYCQENDIELLVIKTPDASRDISQPVYNTVESIAEEYGIDFLNLNYHDDEIGLVPSDFLFDDTHLTEKGARKCARYIGEYLAEHYGLVDHRGDQAYISWDYFAAERQNVYLRQMLDNSEYFAELLRDDKKVTAIPYRLQESDSEDYQKLQEQLAEIPHSDWDKEEVFYGEDCAGKFDFGSNEVVVTKDYDSCKITVNGKSGIEVQQSGLFLVVYDDVNDEIADIVEFERDNGYALKHLYNP